MVPGKNVNIAGSIWVVYNPSRPKRVNNKKLHLLLFHVANLFLVKFGKFDFFMWKKANLKQDGDFL